ncbi:hypothetical protein [Nannocystis punicea]|uniref:Uncharacterized protein n=1 Tax=Nannocystis punicea TaxID=2995304 RepID=A0ABY7GYY4_9BACT|nr:hypothetical protein [Nannocystis poenicansa]WAS92190.1 hypothetical protein O0S08_38910 [Nannocystis poenicansa]
MRTYAYALPFTALLLALTPACATTLCGNDGDCAPTDTATTGDPPASTTDETGTTSEPTSTETETGPTSTSEEATTTTGEPETTTGPGTTAETSTGETTEGPLVGQPSAHNETCAPDDGPAVEFKIDLAERACDSDWPEDAPLLRIVLFKGVDSLALGEHPLNGGWGFASYDDGDGTPETSDQGTVVITEITADGVRGTYEVTLPDDVLLAGAFDSLYCPADVMCG